MHSFFSGPIHRTLKAVSATIALAVCVHAPAVSAPLPNFNVDAKEISVSGLSSGGFMAVQFSVAYSSAVKGAGIIAGGPYNCARGDVGIATTQCSCTGINFFLWSSCRVAPGGTGVDQLIAMTAEYAREGSIESTTHLSRQKIWMFSGAIDSVVPTPVMDDLRAYYRRYISDANIRYHKDLRAEHAMPTDSFGNECGKLGKPYISNCGFDAAGDLLRWIYGELNPKKAGDPGGKFLSFDQSEFVRDGQTKDHGMADSGVVYVPAACDRDGSRADSRRCRLHVAFHGCQQSRTMLGDEFIRHAGYNAWADTNHIIVLYPQTVADPVRNPKGCWNWFGFDPVDPDYVKKNGVQMDAVKRMTDRLGGIASVPLPPAAVTPACFTASNTEHIAAGRARNSFFLAFAKGSNAVMGARQSVYDQHAEAIRAGFLRARSMPIKTV
jgi:hypothetical protein